MSYLKADFTYHNLGLEFSSGLLHILHPIGTQVVCIRKVWLREKGFLTRNFTVRSIMALTFDKLYSWSLETSYMLYRHPCGKVGEMVDLYKGIEIMVQTWTSKRSVMTFDLETLSRSQLILFLQSLCKLLAKVNKGVLMRSDMTLTSDLETIFKVRTLSKAFFRRKIGHWQGFHT